MFVYKFETKNELLKSLFKDQSFRGRSIIFEKSLNNFQIVVIILSSLPVIWATLGLPLHIALQEFAGSVILRDNTKKNTSPPYSSSCQFENESVKEN